MDISNIPLEPGSVIAIAAMDEGRVIGLRGGLPWRIPEDMKRFAALTKGHSVLMGRKTYESLPPKTRPLPDRVNVVVSRSADRAYGAGVLSCTDPLAFAKDFQLRGEGLLWVIGGAEIYSATLPSWDYLYLTKVRGQHPGDAFFPQFEEHFETLTIEERPNFSFVSYKRKN